MLCQTCYKGIQREEKGDGWMRAGRLSAGNPTKKRRLLKSASGLDRSVYKAPPGHPGAPGQFLSPGTITLLKTSLGWSCQETLMKTQT